MSIDQRKFDEIAKAGFNPAKLAEVKADEERQRSIRVQMQQAQERAQRLAIRKPFMEAIVKEVQKLQMRGIKHTASFNIATKTMAIDDTTSIEVLHGMLVVDGFNMDMHVSVEEERSHRGSYFSQPNGKWRIAVEGSPHGDSRRNFPQRKNGTHNYEDIAIALVAKAERMAAERAAVNVQNGNKAVVDVLAAELGVEKYGPVSIGASSNPDRPVRFVTKIEANMTVAQARGLYAALKTAGLVK